ncbi:MAG TPA: magnesium/cobalt transporter CorA, partial [Terriglobales bacterium]|nr:magnesium/cobalt transporter CorA [Terriglobales bacterium]
DIRSLPEMLARWPVTWVNVDGVGDVEAMKQLGEVFDLHPLALEDVVHVHQRPKVEPYAHHLFIVLRMSCVGEHFNSEQLSIFLGKNYLLTIQEQQPGDCLEPVRSRIRSGNRRVRGAGPDYLAYAIIDTVIDNYFPVVERYGDQLESLDDMVDEPHETTIRKIHDIRHGLLVLRRTVSPLREAINTLRADDSGLLTDDTKLYLRDCHDHVVHLVENIQTYQEISSWHIEAALSSLNFRSSEIMRVLTLIATIFIPLSFIASVYGMNFSSSRSPLNMPELNWYFGYPFALGLMGVTAGALLYYFRRKGWV